MSESVKNWESSLKEGEKLLWTGRPTCTSVVDPANKPVVYGCFIIGIIWVILSFIIYLPIHAGVISFVIIDLVPFFMILLPILNARSVKKTYYAITDKRILIDLAGQEYSMDVDENTEIKRNDNGTILVGAAIKTKPRKERHLLLFRGVMDMDKNILGVVLYTTDDPDGAYKALKDR